MNERYFKQRYDSPVSVEEIEEATKTPELDLDLSVEAVPVEETLAQETPVEGTFASVGPVNEPFAAQYPVNRSPVQEVPTESTVDVVDPLDETIVSEAPVLETVPPEAITGASVTPPEALLNREESEHLRTRWNEIQGTFVDEPRSAVKQADVLVSEVIEEITQMFTTEHSSLEAQWNQGNEVSTEDLRKALQRYRSFFNRLVV
jgi:hypothetical protein